jgi:hypothetical protein
VAASKGAAALLSPAWKRWVKRRREAPTFRESRYSAIQPEKRQCRFEGRRLSRDVFELLAPTWSACPESLPAAGPKGPAPASPHPPVCTCITVTTVLSSVVR